MSENIETISKNTLKLLFFAILSVVCFLGYWLYESNQVYKYCSVEAGGTVSVSDF